MLRVFALMPFVVGIALLSCAKTDPVDDDATGVPDQLAGDRAATAAVALEFEGFVQRLLAERCRAGNAAPDDVTTRLLRERIGDRPLTDGEIVSIVRNWTVGELGTILATTDGGRTWQVQKRGGQRLAILCVHARPGGAPLDAARGRGGLLR